MESLGIGKIIESEQHRDAVHMAIVPVVAHDHLSPGQHVGVKDGHSRSVDPIGIVDPFLWSTVQAGEKFWLFLYPGSITSLRHEWTHPAFEDAPISEAEKEAARHVAERLTNSGERWLRNFCANGDCPDYEMLMEAIRNGSSSSEDGEYGITIGEEYISVGGTGAHGSIPPEFWDHVEAVLGRKQELRPSYFSCSC